jgi:hypothetical protein
MHSSNMGWKVSRFWTLERGTGPPALKPIGVERNGVLATDYYCWTGPGWGKKAAFDLAKQALAPEIEEKISDLFDLTPANVGTFDVVLLLGVLYHLKHPLLGLERVASLASAMMVVETVTALDSMYQPTMVFYPGAELKTIQPIGGRRTPPASKRCWKSLALRKLK